MHDATLVNQKHTSAPADQQESRPSTAAKATAGRAANSWDAVLIARLENRFMLYYSVSLVEPA